MQRKPRDGAWTAGLEPPQGRECPSPWVGQPRGAQGKPSWGLAGVRASLSRAWRWLHRLILGTVA